MKSIKYPYHDLQNYAGFSSYSIITQTAFCRIDNSSNFFNNNSPTSISEEQESIRKQIAALNKIKAKSKSLLEKQTVAKNTQQDISEAKEYSNEKAERVSLPHK